jgi:hypothetical protein
MKLAHGFKYTITGGYSRLSGLETGVDNVYINSENINMVDGTFTIDSMENDSAWTGAGSVDNGWFTEGEASYLLNPAIGSTKSATREFNLAGVDNIYFDVKNNSGDGTCKIYIDDVEVYSLSSASVENMVKDVSDIDNTVTIKIEVNAGQFNQEKGYFDNFCYDKDFEKKNYKISTKPGGTVTHDIKTLDVINTTLDGGSSNSFTVNENRFYRLFIREETTFDLMTNSHIGSEKFFTRLYSDNGYTEEFTVDNQYENIVSQFQPVELRLFDNDDNYYRTYLVKDFKENFDVYMVKDSNESDLYQYNVTLDDPLDLWGPPDGTVKFSRYIDDNKGVIINRYWLTGDEVNIWLLYQSRYNATLKHPDSGTYSVGWLDADQDTTKSIKVAAEVNADNIYYMEALNEYISWKTWRNGDNIHVWYQDNSYGTEEVRVYIYHDNGQVWQNTITGQDNFETVYYGSENGTYWVKLEIDHETWGFSPVTSGDIVVDVPELPGIPGSDLFDDMPVPMTNVALFVVFFGVLLSFGPSVAGVGIMLVAVTMAVMVLILGVSISWGVIGLLLFVGFVIQMWIVKRGT